MRLIQFESPVEEQLAKLEANRKQLLKEARKQEKLFSKIDSKFNKFIKKYLVNA